MAGISRTTREVFRMAIFATAGLAICHFLRLLSLASPATAISMLIGVTLGILFADLVTGLVHWGCDTWGGEETPFLGPTLIHSFREHHREPEAMLDHDWVEVSGDSALPVGFGFMLMTLPISAGWLAGHEGIYAMFWSLLSVSAIANQLHQWAHMRRPPTWVRRLQRPGIILSRERHAEHHRAPHLEGYCISSGWLNDGLDRMHFWRVLERAIRLLTGIDPRTGSGYHR